jgi:hypothetical protein
MPLDDTPIDTRPIRTLEKTVTDIQEQLRHGRELLEQMRKLNADIVEQRAQGEVRRGERD